MKQIIIETKLGRATSEHVEQLQKYVNELGSECIAGVLIAETTPPKKASCRQDSVCQILLRY